MLYNRVVVSNLLFMIICSVMVFFISCLFLQKIGKKVGLGINSTLSQPYAIYAYFPIKGSLKKRDLVDGDLNFSDPDLQWIKSRNYIRLHEKLLKNIAAVPGEWLFTVYPNIYVCKVNRLTNGCSILGICLRKDKNGFPLFCQNWHGKKVPNDYFYLQSNRVSNSFDSRYFGLVHKKNIYHRIKMMIAFS